jgi:CubicO group peptidase (beta-lactamase class C family)
VGEKLHNGRWQTGGVELAADFSLVERYVDRIIEQGRVTAAGMAIAIEGEPVFSYVAGEARPGLPASEATLWPLASISKLYTASMVVSLIEEGLLTLGTKVVDILPDFTGDGRETVTLRHLLTHTAGLAYEPENLAELFQANADWVAQMAHGSTDPLRFPPGAGQQYSDTGIGLAALMAVTVTGVSFPELIRSRVLEPGGLRDTFMPPPEGELGRIAQVGKVLGEGTDWAHYNSVYGAQIGHPAYGTVATIGDALRFMLLFDPYGSKRIHSGAALAAMISDQAHAYSLFFAPREAPVQPIANWGLGFILKDRSADSGIASPESFGHEGASGCVIWCDPRQRVSFAFVSNSHLFGGIPEWTTRIEAAINVGLSAASR